MSLLSQLVPQHSRSVLTLRIAGSGTPEPPTAPQPDARPTVRESGGRGEDATNLARSLLADGHADRAMARLEAAVDEHVDVWTPALHTTSRFELISALVTIDDAITDVTVTFTEASRSGSTTLLTWLATGRFTHPAFFDDDELVEPTGAVIRVAGATSVSFNADRRAERIRCYYDRLGVIEQMLTAPATSERC